ncbi:MAG: nitrate ABC transporter substrate-binding protein, partial [Mesorhizobium sp.]
MNRRAFVKGGLAAVAAASAGMQLVSTPGARAAGKV